MHRDQPYWQIGERDHVTQDGRGMKLAIWMSFCAECGQPFNFAAPLGKGIHEPNKRCTEHRRPGISAKTGQCERWRKNRASA